MGTSEGVDNSILVTRTTVFGEVTAVGEAQLECLVQRVQECIQLEPANMKYETIRPKAGLWSRV